MVSRRDFVGISAGAAAALGLTPQLLHALQQGQIIRRAIPTSGEQIPVIGLGSSATFSSVARGSDEDNLLKAVFQMMADKGATVFDTAPSYGASEEVACRIVNDLKIADKMFWATKLNVVQGRGGGGSADPAAARAQVEKSFAMLKRPKIDVIQVHNLSDVPGQLPILHEFKKAGRVKYVGVTTTSDSQYGQLEGFMRNEQLDFIGIDYAIDNRGVEEKILPLAKEKKIAVLAYAPFGRTSLFRRVGTTPLPDYAKDIDATTWAQFFLKWIISNPTITAVTPATSKAANMLDNIGGGIGRLPDAAMRKRMSDFIDALPQAGR
jgi:aryl-alcohol dehydrogenase-like predicted oxidoreductase